MGQTLTNEELTRYVGALSEDHNNKLDKSSADGHWVPKHLTLASGVTYPATDNLEYDLSSYLPNDGYNYEVIFYGHTATGATSGNYIALFIESSILIYSICLTGSQTRTASAVGGYGNGVLPIGADRKVIVDHNSGYTGTFTLQARAYRRLGTNL